MRAPELRFRFLFLLTVGCAAAAGSVVPLGRNAIGTAHPTLLLGAAPDGSWVAICQARADTNHDGKIAFALGIHGDVFGDALAAYLVLGSGPGKPIDRYLGRDQTGRWLAYAREQRRWLLDTKTGSEIALDAPPDAGDAGGRKSSTLDPAPLPSPRFDPLGVNLLYMTGLDGSADVTTRSNQRGQQKPLPPHAHVRSTRHGGERSKLHTLELPAHPRLSAAPTLLAAARRDILVGGDGRATARFPEAPSEKKRDRPPCHRRC
jgi:hypothetical protein